MARVLYKYREMNEFTWKIFSENKLWYSRVKDLNDPNEGLRQQISKGLADAFIRQTKEFQLAGLVFPLVPASSLNHVNPIYANCVEYITDVFQRKKEWDFERKYKFANAQLIQYMGQGFSEPTGFLESIDNVIGRAGVLSLSSDPLNKLLWAHYAGQHHGIAIGISNYSKKAYKPISYITGSTPPSVDLDVYNAKVNFFSTHRTTEAAFNDPSIQKILTTKVDDWSYEKEWRGLKEKYGSYPIEGEITEIIFGLRCPQSQRDEVMQKLKSYKRYRNVRFREISQAGLSLEVRDLF